MRDGGIREDGSSAEPECVLRQSAKCFVDSTGHDVTFVFTSVPRDTLKIYRCT